jgi:hypothetical protein
VPSRFADTALEIGSLVVFLIHEASPVAHSQSARIRRRLRLNGNSCRDRTSHRQRRSETLSSDDPDTSLGIGPGLATSDYVDSQVLLQDCDGRRL